MSQVPYRLCYAARLPQELTNKLLSDPSLNLLMQSPHLVQTLSRDM